MVDFDFRNFSAEEQHTLNDLLQKISHRPLELTDIWYLMDQVWDELGCDNRFLDAENLKAFYQHPIWLLNGLFTETDPVSVQHRNAIADWVGQNSDITRILDFGGGSGVIARFIIQVNPQQRVDIYEPYPHPYFMQKSQIFPQIQFIEYCRETYDCLISTDVLEHTDDPLKLLAEMISQVRNQGWLILANCFLPVIKCHIPTTFHLHYTFNQFANQMGLKYLGECAGGHGAIYQKVADIALDWEKLRRLEQRSQKAYNFRQKYQNFVNPASLRLQYWLKHPLETGKKLLSKLKNYRKI
ncbi:methyltransferase domain-containing protein [Spirulina sp. CCNP1310]|uniref:methyltransferase domain-containing protein n=1 Tax=Spirulina sp. CCNP1310 TaxID=3110249 RepID=UPI002B1EC520|nr:methyltransferase domain-containing protein [Spirulina sp. CCNP1310]MEA5420668.1 methyltransferase domain-containing protein [Spirulina sp. CCNP1310]